MDAAVCLSPEQIKPILLCYALPGPADVSAAVQLEQPQEGGHVGFVSGPFPGTLAWLPQRLLAFFDSYQRP